MKDYAYAQKTEFVATMQRQLDEINRDLDQLAAKIEKTSDAVKADAEPKLQALRDQAAKLRKHLDVAKNATESTWDDVKAGFTKGYSELKDGFNQSPEAAHLVDAEHFPLNNATQPKTQTISWNEKDMTTPPISSGRPLRKCTVGLYPMAKGQPIV